MAPLRRSGFRTTRSASRKTSWAVGPETGASGAAQGISGSIAELAASAAQALQDGLTLVRTRGELVLWLKTATAVGDGFHGAFGIAQATSAAFLAGAASLPTPLTEEDWDGWLYHRYFNIQSPGPIAVATASQEVLQVNNVAAGLRIEVDSKAMRKSSVDEAIYAAIEVVEVGTATMNWAFNCRLLCKLP